MNYFYWTSLLKNVFIPMLSLLFVTDGLQKLKIWGRYMEDTDQKGWISC